MIGLMNSNKNLNIIFQHIRYKSNITNRGFNRAKNITLSDALLPKSSTNDSLRNLVLVMDCHPNFRDIAKLIMDHLAILYESPCMKNVFSNNKTRIRTGFRKTKNLKDLLVPSALPDLHRADTLNIDAIGCFQCNRKVDERLAMLATIKKNQKCGYRKKL